MEIRRGRGAHAPVTPPRVVVIGHDASGNALLRALVIADLLEPMVDVRVVAFGDRVWGPVASDPRVELLPSPRTTVSLPAAARRLAAAVRDADLLVAVKPRILSYGLAALVREGRPLLLDIDDLEHRFTRRRMGWLRQLVEPDREPVTRLLERWRSPVAAITVASRALQRRFGGTWMPHIRDRADLARAASEEGPATRTGLGLDGTFTVGFVGTVRPHKGLAVLAEAVAGLGEDARLLIAGDPGEPRALADLKQRLGRRLVVAGETSLDKIGGVLGACDVVAIPQSRTPEAAHQSPAKLFDAMAAGRPVVAGDVGDTAELLGGAGILVPPDDPAALAAALGEVREDARLRVRLSEAGVARMAEAFALEPWRARMADVIGPLVGSRSS